MLDQRRSVLRTPAVRAARKQENQQAITGLVTAYRFGGGSSRSPHRGRRSRGADIGVFGLVGKGGLELSGKQLLTTTFARGVCRRNPHIALA